MSTITETPKHKKWMVLTYVIIFCVSGLYLAFVIIPSIMENNILLRLMVFLLHPLLSWMLLKIKIPRHHYLSIGLMIAGFLFVNYQLFINFSVRNVLIQIAMGFGQSLLEVGSKFIMHQKYVHPFQFLLFEGIFGIIILGSLFGLIVLLDCYGIRFSFIDKELSLLKITFIEVFGNTSNVALVIGGFLFAIGSNVGEVLINYYYNPTARLMSFQCYLVLVGIYYAIRGFQYSIDFTFQVIGFVIILCSNMIHFEMMILYCFGLEANTQSEITKRSNKDWSIAVNEMNSMRLLEN